MTSDLRTRHHNAYRRASNPREKHNGDGTVTVDKESYLAFLDLAQMGADVDTALWKLEQMEKESAEWVTIKRERME